MARYLEFEDIRFYNLSVCHYNLHDKQNCIITGRKVSNMNDVLFGVIIGSSITLIGQVITQIFQLKGTKWKKYQERLDLIFKERIEAYKVMNTQLFILADAVSKKKI